ncbi:MAG: TlpA disulfide reductase family protein [Candidatus Pseudobacter hemicellulosilyticus]|uniref:TlpA disulfide reductase family protein n=1 Tax=Candidatus Pseudobacter hemicellulosilyticus TaxID=3121375 RepID=A0AAJ6BDG2_9BACT|nr:MAG: TlpA disulfide reductase family protein [Pseudobacter sp.]
MNQRITCLLAAALFLGGALQAQTSFTLKGKLTDKELEGQPVTLRYYNGAKSVMDTCLLTKGQYSFSGTVMEPVPATLHIKGKTKPKTIADLGRDRCDLYLDGGKISVSGKTMASSVAKGGRSQKEFASLQRGQQLYKDNQNLALEKLGQAREANDSTAKNAALAWYQQLGRSADSAKLAFIPAFPNSYVSLNILKEAATTKNLAEDRQGIDKLYQSLSETMKATDIGKDVVSRLEFAEKLSVGKKAIDFTMNDTIGKPVSLAAFKGKYVLLDFWASWCMPCRMENPHVVKAFNKYKDRNFTILSVSLDLPGKHEAWMEAIHKDGLTWTHVSDLKYWNSEPVKLYGVKSVPMNYLIDPNGTIIATHLRGEELAKKLEEVL